MKTAAICVLGLLALASASNAKVTPVQKVIQLMEGMVEKGKEEKQAEQVQFASYETFCQMTSKEKATAIAEAAETITMLQADIEKYEADAARLTQEIGALNEAISGWEGDMNAATKVREKEHADFLKDEKDFQESVEQVGMGMETIEDTQGNVGQAAALTQISKMPKISAEDRKNIKAFLDTSDPQEEADAENLAAGVQGPQANAFESSSQGVIDLFAKMKDKMAQKLAACRKEEADDKFAYDMLMNDLKNSVSRGNEDIAEKTGFKGKALQDAADAKASLADTEAAKAADEAYKSDLDSTCAAKASAFAERQQLRAEEIVAVEKAIEIMGGDAVAGSADKHLPALLQTKKTSFAQLRAVAKNPSQMRVAEYLKAAAKRLDSKVLSALSMRVAYDPFKSVKKMIKDLVIKLMEEANEEAEHKGWCDTELSTNEQTRNEKTASVETLTAERDELEATVGQLGSQIAELSQEIADLDAAIKEATDLRAKERAKNLETIEDAKAAQQAVSSALKVLKDFYEKAGEATSLVQTKAKQPEIFDDKPYQGMGGSAGGVVGMVEVIQSDFERLEAETEAAEEQGQKEHDAFLNDSSSNKASKDTEMKHKIAKKTDKEGRLVATKKDLAGTQNELDKAMQYYEKLKPTCVDAGVSYEDRVARRKEEIQSLQEALKILSGEDI